MDIDFSGRFVIGVNKSPEAPGDEAFGRTGRASQSIMGMADIGGSVDVNVDEENRPPYYVLAYIQRTDD